ncbi:MAG: DedA family protein [Gemmatimonadota bacterium]|nr:DedA family protein [Gemmatimonadota bacterium]
MFPPVPADTAVAIGAVLSAAGPISAWTIFLVTWVANVGMAAVVYGMARTAGRAFFRGPLGSRLLRPPALQRLELLYGRYGTWAIFFSRFIPGVRAVVPPFAGVANLGAVRALVPLTIASGVWYGGLTFLAVTTVRNLDQIGAFATRLNTAAVATIAVAIVAVTVVVVVRRRRRADAS